MFNFLKGKAKPEGRAKSDGKSRQSKPSVADPSFEIVSLDQWRVAFRSQSVYPICQTMVLFVSGGPNGALQSCRIEVFLNSSRMVSADTLEYTAELTHAPPEFEQLFKSFQAASAEAGAAAAAAAPVSAVAEPALAAAPAGAVDNRVATRASRSFRVVSQDLQRFKAMCGDISSSGIKLVAAEEIEKGKQLELDLDFDDFRFPKVRFRAEVVWCKRRDDSTFWVGMRFLDMQDEERRLLETYVEFVSRMQTPMDTPSPRS